MKYSELGKYYLCGIGGRNKEVYDYKIGIYNKKRDSFHFTNGVDGSIELYRKPLGSSEIYVLTAVCLQEIDDNGLLDVQV